jgi:hypothetical protein
MVAGRRTEFLSLDRRVVIAASFRMFVSLQADRALRERAAGCQSADG